MNFLLVFLILLFSERGFSSYLNISLDEYKRLREENERLKEYKEENEEYKEKYEVLVPFVDANVVALPVKTKKALIEQMNAMDDPEKFSQMASCNPQTYSLQLVHISSTRTPGVKCRYPHYCSVLTKKPIFDYTTYQIRFRVRFVFCSSKYNEGPFEPQLLFKIKLLHITYCYNEILEEDSRKIFKLPDTDIMYRILQEVRLTKEQIDVLKSLRIVD